MVKTRTIILALIAAGVFASGTFTGFKLTKEPVCNCPEVVIPPCPPAVEVQNLDVDKLKRLKSFTFAPQYSGNIYLLNANDTTKLK